MTDITLTPDLEQFVKACVASGRYASIDAVARTALERMQAQEDARARLVASLEDARTEGDKHGFLTLDEVEADIRGALREGEARTPG